MRYALRKGAVVVASAGNGGEDGDHVSYPAAYPGVIAVAAVDRYGARAAFSTRRWYATVAAPARTFSSPTPTAPTTEGWGTSAAAAFTSGAVALARAAHPDLSPAQIKELISDTAGHTPQGGRSDAVGTGVVDPAAAIEMGSHIKPREQQPPVGKYGKEYFGSAKPGHEGGPGWFATLAALLGALLIGAALAVHRGFTPRTRPRPRTRVGLPGPGPYGGPGLPGGP